jgi:antitoxin ParD1/3/4
MSYDFMSDVFGILIKKIIFTIKRENIMQLLTCHLPEAFLAGIDKMINAGVFPNRSEAIRCAIRDLIKNELTGWLQPTEQKTANFIL